MLIIILLLFFFVFYFYFHLLIIYFIFFHFLHFHMQVKSKKYMLYNVHLPVITSILYFAMSYSHILSYIFIVRNAMLKAVVDRLRWNRKLHGSLKRSKVRIVCVKRLKVEKKRFFILVFYFIFSNYFHFSPFFSFYFYAFFPRFCFHFFFLGGIVVFFSIDASQFILFPFFPAHCVLRSRHEPLDAKKRIQVREKSCRMCLDLP